MTAQRAHSAGLFGMLERGFEGLINRSVDLLFGRIEFYSTSVTIHGGQALRCRSVRVRSVFVN